MAGSSQFDVGGLSVAVTGAGRGLGRALAKGFAAAGARVAVAGRTKSDVERVAGEIASSGGQAVAIAFDARKEEDCRMVVTRAEAAFGPIDAMIVNHGVTFHADPESFPAEEFRAVVETNLTSCFLCAQAAGRAMIAAGRKGSIVLISSNASVVTFDGLLAYSASKAGLDQLGRQLAAEWGPKGVRVNMIGPGYMNSHMRGTEAEYDDPQFLAALMAKIPLRRRGEPEELVGPAIFLASDASSYLTGAYLPVDGGYTLP
jgi:NAD(P)-dependent dehydrogenase (short-subunit alcohol dehydrogenase family)